MPDLRLAARPFDQQVAFFRRKLSVPTAEWTGLWREHHAHGFMVAGAFKTALLDDLRRAVDQAIAEGITLASFKKEFDAIVKRHGWQHAGGAAWRARVIYDTNVRQSFNAGRYAQMTTPAMLQARPFWQYRHNDKGISKHPRPLHLAWHGRVLRHDHPWWRTHMPQNGWGCKCGVRALSQADLERLGKSSPDAVPDDGTYRWVDPRGRPHEIPNGIDPGFDYNVGEAALSLPAARRFGEQVAAMPPAWRARALNDAHARAPQWHADLGDAIETMLAARARPQGRAIAAGMLRESAFAKLSALGVPPATVTIVLADAELAHLVRETKQRRGAAIDADWLRALPLHMATPDVVLYDRVDPALLYAWRLDGGRYIKLVVRIDYRQKGVLAREPTNWLRSGGIVDHRNLTGARYEAVEGAL